jgi:hypothetical protein
MNKQREIDDGMIGWLRNGPLVQWPDGLWRGLGAALGDDDFETEDIKRLVHQGRAEITPVGVVLRAHCNLPF